MSNLETVLTMMLFLQASSNSGISQDEFCSLSKVLAGVCLADWFAVIMLYCSILASASPETYIYFSIDCILFFLNCVLGMIHSGPRLSVFKSPSVSYLNWYPAGVLLAPRDPARFNRDPRFLKILGSVSIRYLLTLFPICYELHSLSTSFVFSSFWT